MGRKILEQKLENGKEKINNIYQEIKFTGIIYVEKLWVNCISMAKSI